MIERAGLKPWPELLQNLRATNETELFAKNPAKDVTSWLGNSPRIAHRHYAMATDESFAPAITEPTISTPHRTPQTLQDEGSRGETGDKEKPAKSAIDAGKDVIRLDLSALDSEAEKEEGYPARVSPTAENTGRNEAADTTTPKTTPNPATMFVRCMRTHLTDEQILELIDRLSQPRTENTG